MAEVTYPWQAPFVGGDVTVDPERHGAWDLYAGALGDEVAPAVLFVHGGPLPTLPFPPREWPVYRGYAAAAARAGVVGVTVDHRLHGSADYAGAWADVRDAIDGVRADPRVDGNRIAVWAFSGGAPVLTPLLQDPPAWLRCVALSYPVLDDVAETRLPEGFRPLDTQDVPRVPIVLTQVGRESPSIAAGVASYLARAAPRGAAVEVIAVPEGRHGFDALPAVPGAAEAVRDALDAVVIALRR